MNPKNKKRGTLDERMIHRPFAPKGGKISTKLANLSSPMHKLLPLIPVHGLHPRSLSSVGGVLSFATHSGMKRMGT
jgi:hypothetical protein